MNEEKARILIVDDDEAILIAMLEYFSLAGFAVDGVCELEEARSLLVSRQYALVIADLRLTGMRGEEGLEILQFVDRVSPRTRTMLLTGHASPEIELEAARSGGSATLRKPIPLPELLRIAGDLLRVERLTVDA